MKITNYLSPFNIYRKRARIKSRLQQKKRALAGSATAQWFKSKGMFLSANDKAILDLKDIHKNRRCFIIASGPSLKVEDLNKLKGEITFACNKIYLAFPSTDWRPTYYSVYDALVAENNKHTIEALTLKNIFGEGVRPYLEDTDTIWVREIEHPIVDGAQALGFSTNLLRGAFGGWTVIYMQLQMALYMGIREIYLIGLDFSFEVPQGTGELSPSGEVVVSQGEINHFHPDYRIPGETWTMPQLLKQHQAFTTANNFVRNLGGQIFNASRATKLDVFKRVCFDDIFPPKAS